MKKDNIDGLLFGSFLLVFLCGMLTGAGIMKIMLTHRWQ